MDCRPSRRLAWPGIRAAAEQALRTTKRAGDIDALASALAAEFFEGDELREGWVDADWVEELFIKAFELQGECRETAERLANRNG